MAEFGGKGGFWGRISGGKSEIWGEKVEILEQNFGVKMVKFGDRIWGGKG